MAQKVKKWEEWLTLSGETLKVVSYADYFARRPLFSSLQIKNTGGEAINDVTLSFYNENGMVLPLEKTLEEIPFESVVEVELDNLLSPHYFAGLEEVKEERRTIIFYESPHRLKDTLKDMLKVLGNRKIAVNREITKKYQEIIREDIETVINIFNEKEVKGEFVLIVEGFTNPYGEQSSF